MEKKISKTRYTERDYKLPKVSFKIVDSPFASVYTWLYMLDTDVDETLGSSI